MKAMRIVIFTIVGILVLGCIGVGIIYFTTDIFQSNQKMFYKYISQENITEVFDTSFINQFINNLQIEPNNTSGKIVINAEVAGEDILKNSKIAFDNNLDNANKLFESKITFSDNTSKNLLGLEIVRNKDVYGIMVKDVITQYLAVENKDLKKFTNKLGFNANTLNIPDKIDIEKYLNEVNDMQENITQDLSEVFAYIKEQVSQDSYSKIAKTNIEINGQIQEVIGYKLNLNSKETSEILNKFDEEVLEKIKTFLENFTEEEVDYDLLKSEIMIYIKDKNLVKVNVLINNDTNLTINLSKTFEGNSTIYELEISKDENQMICNISKKSESVNDDVSYNAELSMTSEEKDFVLNFVLELNTVFNSDFEITEFDDKNCVIANNMESATLVEVLKVIWQKIYSQTGFENTLLNVIYNNLSADKAIKEATNSMENTIVEMHNSMFNQYEGEQKENAVKSLLNIIETNNATSGNVLINILYNDSQEQFEINSDKKYEISFKYNEEGYINIVNIKEK